MTETEIDTDRFVHMTRAHHVTGLSRVKIATQAVSGVIRTEVRPGSSPLYHLGDCFSAAERDRIARGR